MSDTSAIRASTSPATALDDGAFTILERRVVLDLEALRPHGKVSFIV